jgi:hypothetical protein
MNRPERAAPRGRDNDPLAIFVRGATVGAFVGAVIAGSEIWRRGRRRPPDVRGGGVGESRGRRAVRPAEDEDAQRP